jgi:hypothetical protein
MRFPLWLKRLWASRPAAKREREVRALLAEQAAGFEVQLAAHETAVERKLGTQAGRITKAQKQVHAALAELEERATNHEGAVETRLVFERDARRSLDPRLERLEQALRSGLGLTLEDFEA